MAKVKFNKSYRDKKLNRLIKANEPVEMTLERADEVVETIKGNKVKGYENFKYERVDEKKKEKKKESPKKKDEK